ncbi:hypothetical protein ACGFX8_17710 [Streptomyces sp. NPDC048362]|uniref:hypothetical protein n=1 Tax=Streptomyces sp. NPDC048362 TaxID=3365539 RepID=UPI00371A4707
MTTRRTVRTVSAVRSAALMAVAVAAAFSLGASQSGGKDAAVGSEMKVAGSATTVSTGNGAALGGPRTSTGVSETDGRTEVSVVHSATASSVKPGAATPVRTQTLADGSTARIYELGAQHYRARLVYRGAVYATLETGRRDAGLDANDMFVVLTLDGQVHSWMGGGHQGPGTFHLAGGWTAKVTKTGENRYRAQITGHDGVDATLDANQHDVGVDANGVYIVLSAAGVLSAHK